jgi:hypothetical protein
MVRLPWCVLVFRFTVPTVIFSSIIVNVVAKYFLIIHSSSVFHILVSLVCL